MLQGRFIGGRNCDSFWDASMKRIHPDRPFRESTPINMAEKYREATKNELQNTVETGYNVVFCSRHK